ncbi:penicillin-binding protein 1B [Idiomarina xiamenensis]|uniref:Penicillin-binding protein 1B n=1 Tax=Idiomarina xiamenensis 10-D-4 TaxID=740709 RepID=K2JVL6_9GAMM|nr:penicillin-binding protein 1B [Idiomarina xiamenensis]EKE87461.1 peptidoglycan synthetase [Idiomarina xiamenensis 10-D-4]
MKDTKIKRTLRYLLITGLKLSLVGLAILFFYLLYLDSVLTERFSQSRYQAPALVYGRAMTLAPSAQLSHAEVLKELKLLRYRATATAAESGEYTHGRQHFVIHRRPFDFADGPRMAEQVRVEFQGDRISRLVSWPDGRALSSFRLEPPLVARINGSNDEDRLLVGLEVVPNLLVETLLLVEDQNFYHHYGVSPGAIARAMWANLRAGYTVQGGSTLTQQLVKNLYLTRDQTLWRKANEALMALVIDYRFSKNEILETYLNEVYFGQDRGHAIHGVGLASLFYFGKQVQELDAADVAMLVGLVKGPSYYDPRRSPERARQRRDLVLQLMFNNDLINRDNYLAGLDTPLVSNGSGRLISETQPHYVERVQQELQRIELPQAWQSTGLRIFTYLDPQLQQAAEAALEQRLKQLSDDEQLQGALVVADYQQAGITALVGDRHNRRGSFNRALLALRPVGSLVKPVIYGAALSRSDLYSLGSMLDDSPMRVSAKGEDDWQPRNYDGKYVGPISLYDAFVESRNIPAVRVGLNVGIAELVRYLRGLGVHTPIAAYPALTLGSVQLSPLAVTRIYAAIANQGRYRPLATINAVTTHAGDLIYQRQDDAGAAVFSREVASLLRYTMQGVVAEGTGRGLNQAFPSAHLAGKSGTTNDLRDAWFVAFDAKQVMTSWVGRDDNQPMGLTGSSGALPVIAGLLQRQAPRALTNALAEGVTMQAYNRENGVQVPLACNNARRLPGISQTLPEDINCDGEIDKKNWFERLFGG